MLDLLEPIAAAARIRPPQHPVPIAVVGAGAIVDVAHLPAYRQLGLEIAGIFDLDHTRATEVAGRHGIDRVYDSLEQLLADDVPIVDIAILPWAQPDVVRQAIAAGKDLLCQKPFAPDYPAAQQLAAEVEAAGRKVVVNQQMRYEEGIAAARAMVHAGWIGAPTAMTIDVDIDTDWSAWAWLVDSPQLEIMFHSIHYFDSIRSILGNPDRVFAVIGRRPGQVARAETRTMATLVYDSGVRALVHSNHENHAGDPHATVRIDGEHGSIRGTLGLLYDYPHGRPDTLEVHSSSLPTDGWLPYPVTHRWLPDAVAGPMADLQRWVAGGAPAPTRVQDNLHTLALVHSLYRSARTGQVQEPAQA